MSLSLANSATFYYAYIIREPTNLAHILSFLFWFYFHKNEARSFKETGPAQGHHVFFLWLSAARESVIPLHLRFPGGRVFITSDLLDNLISFTAEMVFEWDRWYFLLVYWERKEKEKGVFGKEGVEIIVKRPAVTRRWQQVRTTWCPQVARLHEKGRRKACLGWVYVIIHSLHPAMFLQLSLTGLTGIFSFYFWSLRTYLSWGPFGVFWVLFLFRSSCGLKGNKTNYIFHLVALSLSLDRRSRIWVRLRLINKSHHLQYVTAAKASSFFLYQPPYFLFLLK